MVGSNARDPGSRSGDGVGIGTDPVDTRAATWHELRGKTFGFVGYGHIGSRAGVLAEAIGMRVLWAGAVSARARNASVAHTTDSQLQKGSVQNAIWK